MPTGVGIAKVDGEKINARARRTLRRLRQEAGTVITGSKSNPRTARDANRYIRGLNVAFTAGTIREDDQAQSSPRIRRAVEALREGT